MEELLENCPRTQTFEARDDLTDRQTQRKRTEDVDVVATHFHLFDDNVVDLGDFTQQLLHAFANVTY
jgi:hypothetical protein